MSAWSSKSETTLRSVNRLSGNITHFQIHLPSYTSSRAFLGTRKPILQKTLSILLQNQRTGVDLDVGTYGSRGFRCRNGLLSPLTQYPSAVSLYPLVASKPQRNVSVHLPIVHKTTLQWAVSTDARRNHCHPLTTRGVQIFKELSVQFTLPETSMGYFKVVLERRVTAPLNDVERDTHIHDRIPPIAQFCFASHCLLWI